MARAHRWFGCLLVVVACLTAPALVAAQESRSATLAGELVGLLDARQLDSVAARHAGEADRFVGALYFPGSQLLVITAEFTVPERLAILLGDRKYRDIYIDLNSASVPATKFFVSDLGADGLVARPRGGRPPDSVDIGNAARTFNGNWRDAGLSEQDYMALFEKTDAEYARLLESLIAQLRTAN